MALIAALSLLCGCASIPKEQLDAYVSSVGEAKQAGQTLLADWRSARAESDRREAGRAVVPPAPIPLVRPPSAPGNGSPLSPEDTRLLAWEAIAEYTAVLARLNAGESVAEVKQTTGRLFGLATSIAGSAFPGAGALGPLLQELAGQIEQARTAAEFKKAVHKGVPIITKIITDVLLQDVNNHYTLRATLANEDLAHVELESNLSEADKKIKRARIIDESKAFSEALDSYAALLSKTKLSLEALETAVDQPIDFAAEANRLLDLSFSLKQHWAAYENARKEARN